MKYLFPCLFLVLLGSLSAKAQLLTTIRGQVLDSATEQSLERVRVGAVGAIAESYTNSSGDFIIRLKGDYPMILELSAHGYRSQRFQINEGDGTDGLQVLLQPGQDPRLSQATYATHRHESTLGASPFELYTVSGEELQELPAFTVYEALDYLPGTEMATNGPLNQRLNTRGFGDFQNTRFVQLVDGVDIQMPGAGYALGNLAGINPLDLGRAELLPGAHTAIYGPNALNGVLNLRSKSPFEDQGLSALVTLGATGSEDQGVEFALRYADQVTEESALKVSFSYSEAAEWAGTNSDNVRPGAATSVGPDLDPGYDGLHVYGDEEAALFPFGQSGADIIVGRTGYAEADVLPYASNNLKFDLAYQYNFNDRMALTLSYGIRSADYNYTGINRGRVLSNGIDILKAELVGRDYFVRFYNSSQSYDESYDAKLAARNVLFVAKGNTSWFLDYGTAFGGGVADRGVPAGDLAAARGFADGVGLNLFGVEGPRILPGSGQFDFVLSEVVLNNIGFLEDEAPRSEIENDMSFSQFEAMYNFSRHVPWFDGQIGVRSRTYNINSTSLIASPGLFFERVAEQGVYLDLSKQLLQDKLYLNGTARLDNNEFFGTQTNARLGAALQLSSKFTLRAAYSTGFRNPSFTEQFIDKEIGEGDLKGGSVDFTTIVTPPPNSRPIPIVGNAIFLNAVDAYSAAYERDIAAGFSLAETINRNLFLLGEGIVQEGDLQPLQGEQNTAIELGFRAEPAPGVLLDVSAWQTTYDGYIGRIGVVRPLTTISVTEDTTASALLVRDKRSRQVAFTYANAKEEVSIMGLTASLNYQSAKGLQLGVQGRITDFSAAEEEQIDIEANTPGETAQFMLGHRNIITNLGATLIYRWQGDMNWQGSFASGPVPSFSTLNLQVNYRLPDINAMVQLGGTNLLSTDYFDYYGGPQIGSSYYITIRVGGLQFN